jgi:hypothetical protein
MVDIVDDARELVRASDVFEPGYLIEMRVGAPNTPDSPAGDSLLAAVTIPRYSHRAHFGR